jgi:hypothetical protein
MSFAAEFLRVTAITSFPMDRLCHDIKMFSNGGKEPWGNKDGRFIEGRGGKN